MSSRNKKNHAWAKPDSVIGPSNGSVIADPSVLATINRAV
jgi:hypothetical protein